MGNIKYGDIEYFELLDLQDKLKYWKYSKFDLQYLDKLKMEIDLKVKAINQQYNEQLQRSTSIGVEKS